MWLEPMPSVVIVVFGYCTIRCIFGFDYGVIGWSDTLNELRFDDYDLQLVSDRFI
jgi:hypothetical protein